MLKLVFPTLEHKKMVLEYKEEFVQNGDSMDGCNGLDKDRTFEAWVKACEDNLDETKIPSYWVPASTYLAINEAGELVGMVNIRHRLNDALLQHGGHIGYSVRKSKRRQGYATEMLGLVLEECEKLGIDRALVTCAKTNIGSARTIQKNGGVLENEIPEGERITQRYWIEITVGGK